MRIHFFTAPFYFAFIWFRWRLRRILDDGFSRIVSPLAVMLLS